jgi:hypothetical protein
MRETDAIIKKGAINGITLHIVNYKRKNVTYNRYLIALLR